MKHVLESVFLISIWGTFLKFCDCMHIKHIFFQKQSSRSAGQNFIKTKILIYPFPPATRSLIKDDHMPASAINTRNSLVAGGRAGGDQGWEDIPGNKTETLLDVSPFLWLVSGTFFFLLSCLQFIILIFFFVIVVILYL